MLNTGLRANGMPKPYVAEKVDCGSPRRIAPPIRAGRVPGQLGRGGHAGDARDADGGVEILFKAAAIPPKIYGALDAKGLLELIRSMAG